MNQKQQEEVLQELAVALNGLNFLLTQALICEPKEQTSQLEFTLVDTHNAIAQLYFHLATTLSKYRPINYTIAKPNFLNINSDNSISFSEFHPMEENTVH